MTLQKLVLVAIAILSLNTLAFANGDAGCGLGGLIMGRNTFVSQTAAATTNGLYSNQVFAITSGTSGCKRSGFVKEERATETFVAYNVETLRDEVARGQGEHVAALATLMGCRDGVRLGTALQQNYGKIFGQVEPAAIVHEMKDTVRADQALMQSCKVTTAT